VVKLRPGAFISADLLGPFPISSNGNRMIIVVTDLMTRYVICGALRDGTAMEVAQFLVNQVICVYGGFEIILTDNGMCFRAKLMDELSKALNFSQKFTAPYSPECNGLTERFNKTLAQMLSSLIGEASFAEWDKNLPSVIFAHNTSVQATIKEVPFYLMFGREPVLPMDIALRLPTSSLAADAIVHRLELAFARARKNLHEKQDQMKVRFDQGRKEASFQVGDLVLYEVPTRKKGEPDKLQKKTQGPYTIVTKLSDHLFILEKTKNGKISRERASVRRLHHWEKESDNQVNHSEGDRVEPEVLIDSESEKTEPEIPVLEIDNLEDGVVSVNNSKRKRDPPPPDIPVRKSGRKRNPQPRLRNV
jgi:hypothetical protein